MGTAAQRKGKSGGSGAQEGGGPRVLDQTSVGHDLPPTGEGGPRNLEDRKNFWTEVGEG